MTAACMFRSVLRNPCRWISYNVADDTTAFLNRQPVWNLCAMLHTIPSLGSLFSLFFHGFVFFRWALGSYLGLRLQLSTSSTANCIHKDLTSCAAPKISNYLQSLKEWVIYCLIMNMHPPESQQRSDWERPQTAAIGWLSTTSVLGRGEQASLISGGWSEASLTVRQKKTLHPVSSYVKRD